MKLSKHFVEYSLKEREYLSVELCERIINNCIKSEVQNDGRIRYWGFDPALNKFIRVVVESDGETLLTAHFDRNFKKSIKGVS